MRQARRREIHAMRRLATATPIGLIETSGGQEDVQSFAWEAAGKLARALRHARAVTACELLAGYQAAALSDWPAQARRQAPAGSRVLLDWLAGIIGPIENDRPFGEDLERLIEASAGARPLDHRLAYPSSGFSGSRSPALRADRCHIQSARVVADY